MNPLGISCIYVLILTPFDEYIKKVHDPFKRSTLPIRLLFAFLLAQLSPVTRLLHVAY